ncbi:MAG: hypothetical protein ACE5G2_07295 [Candidatus Krumholzibacteriia bacterium]
MRRLATRQTIRTLAIFLAIAAACILLVRALSRPSVRNDGIGYYAPLASIVFDGDLDLSNEVKHAHPFIRRSYFLKPDGTIVDPYAIGAAVLWAPVIYVSYLLDPDRAPRQPGTWRNASKGFQARHVRALALATGLEAVLACAVLFFGMRRSTGRLAAALGAGGAALGTPLVYYALADPSYAHTASFLACSALLVAVLADRRKRLPLPLLGALWGLASLVRWQDAVLGLLLAPRLLEEVTRVRTSARRAIGGLLLFCAAAAIVFLPQILFWQRIYGRPLVMTVDRSFMQWGGPQILPFLFSTWHGAFIWSPLLLAGFVGVAFAPHRGLRWSLLGAMALEIYICSAAGDWWGSGGFAARRLTAVAPIAAYGLAVLVARAASSSGRRRSLVATAVALVALGAGWNVRLAQYNLAGLLPFNPANVVEYHRHYPRGDPHRQRYALWDHVRLGREVVEAERTMWKRRSR